MKNNKKPAKTRMIIKNYEKKFENFEEMVNNLRILHPEMDNIFVYENYENVNPKDVAQDVLHYFANNMPDVVERLNLPVYMSISANNVALKTTKFFALKWQFKYDENGFIVDLSATVTTFSKDRNPEALEAMISALEYSENGWTLVEK